MLHRTTSSGSHRRGFTLLEMIVSVAIMAIVVGAAIPVTSKVLTYKARNATREELELLSQACSDYFQDVEQLPTDLVDLLVNPGVKAAPSWAGPYLPGVVTDQITKKPGYLVDAWSRDYTVAVTGDVLTLRSFGEDAEQNTADDLTLDLDITWVRREKTRQRLEIVNRAIGQYNAQYLPLTPLPLDYASALKALVAAKLLPDDPDYASDAWGDGFLADPAGKQPVVRVDSLHLNAQLAAAAAKKKPKKKGK